MLKFTTETARKNMSHAARNGCICSSCFVRRYELYDTRSAMGKKKGSIKPFRLPTAEEVERTVWKSYLQKLQNESKNVKVDPVRKPSKATEEIQVVREIHPSEVFVESPISADGRQLIGDVDATNFWDFVYGQEWKGRIRVCEGELMYKITETLKTFVSRKKIADFTVTRVFAAQNTENENDTIPRKQVKYISQTH